MYVACHLFTRQFQKLNLVFHFAYAHGDIMPHFIAPFFLHKQVKIRKEIKWVHFHVADKTWYEARRRGSPSRSHPSSHVIHPTQCTHPRTRSIEGRRVNKFSACPFSPRFMVGREISLFLCLPLFCPPSLYLILRRSLRYSFLLSKPANYYAKLCEWHFQGPKVKNVSALTINVPPKLASVCHINQFFPLYYQSTQPNGCIADSRSISATQTGINA